MPTFSVMYHYVREGDQPPNYYYLDLDDFRRQLDHLETNYGFISRETFLNAVNGKCDALPSGVILTFDDGFRDHYQFVYPELKKRDLWGMFYVPGGPYRTGKLLDVHRIHVLLGSVTGQKLLNHTTEIVDEDMLPHQHIESFRQAYREFDDTEATKQAKKILNMFMKEPLQENILDKLFDQLNVSETPVDQFYIRPEEICEMHEDGMLFGAHTMNHPVLSKLSPSDQKQEIIESFRVLESFIDNSFPRHFCYPYGKKHAYNETTIDILNSADCKWSFIVDPKDLTVDHIRNAPQELPRYDCNSFPYGEASGEIGSGSP